MKQSYFILAESVNMFPMAKVVIVGTFDTINATGLPAVFGPFGIAIRIEAAPSERGRTYTGLISLKKVGAKSPTISIQREFTFPEGDGPMAASAVFALGLPPLQFESAGIYVFELRVGRKCVASTKLWVRVGEQPPKEQTPPKKLGRSPSRKKH